MGVIVNEIQNVTTKYQIHIQPKHLKVIHNNLSQTSHLISTLPWASTTGLNQSFFDAGLY